MPECSALQQQADGAEIVRAWVAAHPFVDSLLHAAVLIVLGVIILGGACITLYSAWFLLRLLRPTNVGNFLKTGIPTRVKGTLAGAGVEVIGEELAQVIPAFQTETADTLEKLAERISKLENQFDTWEDSSGKA